jgi:membrane-associated phospholipid phosphatase
MPWRKILRVIYPTDLITIAYLAITGVFIFLSAFALDNPFSHLGYRLFYLLFIAAIILLDYYFPKKIISAIHAFYPLALLGFLYSETDELNNVFFHNLDQWVSTIEVTIFQSQPSVWLSVIFPWKWLAELMNLAYFSFYVLIFVLCYRIYIKSKENFQYASFVICFSFYIYYIIFIVFPVAGPQFYFPAPENQVREGYVFSYIMTLIHEIAERPTAAFPSSHVGIMFILWYLCIKFDRKLLKWYIPFGILLIISTVYIKAHYVVDVIAGILTVPTMYWVSKNTFELFEHFSQQELTMERLYTLSKNKVQRIIEKVHKPKKN